MTAPRDSHTPPRLASHDYSGAWLGRVVLDPLDPVTVGSLGSWTLTYTAGDFGIDDGGAILIAARHTADWGSPQTSDPTGANYVRATTTAEAKLHVRFSSEAYVRPWRQGVVVSVVDGHVGPGDTITVVLGDQSRGSPGLQMQTFPEQHFRLRVLVDCFGSGDYRPLDELPSLQLVPGPAARLVAIGPSMTRVGQATWLLVRALDRWGNPAPTYRGTVQLVAPDGSARLPQPHQFQPDDRGCYRFEGIRYQAGGIIRLQVTDVASGLVATANPCLCRTDDDPAALTLYWGDLHGQSEETIGTGDVEAYWAYLRDVAGVDFGAHCGNDFQITPDFYHRLRGIVQRYHEPGRFVSFLSYEWSGNHAAGGDHNVYFLHDDPARSQIHRSSHWQVADHTDLETDRYPVAELRRELRGREDVLLLPHVGGRRARLDTVDDVAQSPLIEITSVHGRFPWFAHEALALGLKVGFIGGSDDHSGRPGASPPTNKGLICWGGLTAVYAPALTREALWAAFKRRYCYGTTGARVIVALEADGRPMGDEYRARRPPRFTGRVHGTAPLEQVQLRRGADAIWTYDAIGAAPPRWDGETARARLRITWSGAESKNRAKVTTWDGDLRLEGGRILAAAPYGTPHPAEGLVGWDDGWVRWRSRTSGDADGVILGLEIGAAAVLHLATPPLTRSVQLRDVGAEPLLVELGGVNRQVEFRWVRPEAGPLDLEWSYVDERPPAGEHAYWLWVVQADGEWAWSSPIFVDIAPPGGPGQENEPAPR